MAVGRNTAPTRPVREALGADLRAQRERLGMSQRDVSAMTGISQGSVSLIEQAHSDPLASSLIVLAGAVGREVGLVASYHLPLLDLTADEIEDLIDAARVEAETSGGQRLLAVLDKLTNTEEG